MEENVRKVRKSRISTGKHSAVKRGRIHRFAKWAEETHGYPFRTMYYKLRQNRAKTWETKGITRCMDEFGFHGSPAELWDKCVKNKFCEFMESQQMSRMTIWKRFSTNNFNEVELKGIRATYRYWRENVDELKN